MIDKFDGGRKNYGNTAGRCGENQLDGKKCDSEDRYLITPIQMCTSDIINENIRCVAKRLFGDEFYLKQQ